MFMLSLLLALGACSKDDDNSEPKPGGGGEENPPVATVEPLDLASYDNGSGVMMQAFYWDVEPRFEWWDILSEQVDDWADAGIDRIWLPVASKGNSGGYSMGYDVSDYFDFGDYNQHGTTETRFGSRDELENLIATAHDNDVEVIADIVINHNSGGGLEYNPYREQETYTLFDEEHGNASGMFNRNYEDFHPNDVSESDREAFFAFQETDLDHDVQYVQDWLWNKENSVAKYYKNVMGFDGWRFDYVKGFEPWVIQEWMDAVGGFAVGEYWDGYSPTLSRWVEESGISAFDFAAFYEMEKAFDRNEDLTMLENGMLWKTHPDKAVTFVANHDTEVNEYEDNMIAAQHKLQAYSYILTHPGYPTIFYQDYTNPDFQEQIDQLILIHNSIATGSAEILYADQDEYIMRREGTDGNPGLILYLSLNGNKRRTVNTNWDSTMVMDYTSNTNYTARTSSNGVVTLESSASGFAVYSIMEE